MRTSVCITFEAKLGSTCVIRISNSSRPTTLEISVPPHSTPHAHIHQGMHATPLLWNSCVYYFVFCEMERYVLPLMVLHLVFLAVLFLAVVVP